MELTLGADILTDYAAASDREWLITNGLGGYASASLAGSNTRRYHGLLVAALTPPTGRRILFSRLEEAVTLDAAPVELATNQYPGALYPQGFHYLERFDLYPAPTFLFRPREDVQLEKRVWMAHGEHTTYVRYTLLNAPKPVPLRLTPLVCWKDYHTEMHVLDGFPLTVQRFAGETAITLTPDVPVLRLLVSNATDSTGSAGATHFTWEPAHYWHFNIEHEREQERGQDWHEDLYCPGHFHAMLSPGQSLTLTATIELQPTPPDAAWTAYQARQTTLLRVADADDDFGQALTLAADAFVVEGGREPASPALINQSPTHIPRGPTRSTVLAGYPWFTDWGRDTMISLPGLCLATGRADVARDILASFARCVDRGMLPNRFPDEGETPEYNTADATLWYFQAIWAYVTDDQPPTIDGSQPSSLDPKRFSLARDLWPTLTDIVDWHVRGTRYGIGVDPEDGLLRAGEPGVQLTWMDAKVGDWVVTPRIGKPVEINALWVNALRIMEALAAWLGEDWRPYTKRARQAERGFRAAFVRPDGRGLYDVVGDDSPDPAIRPNQIFAVSLPHSPLPRLHWQPVVETVERELLTPYGLRTLSPSDPAYRGHYGGNAFERDGAYHQGTVWPWLLGPFVEAHYQVYGDPERARSFLLPLQAHLREAGVGQISEVFDGDPPHRPNGCIAQAWSVAEVLRMWKKLGAGSEQPL